MKNKVGMVLGGGGARGSYQIGVIRALEEENITTDIEVVSGTSIGAINTAFFMVKDRHKKMFDAWKKISGKEIFGSGINRFKKDKKGLYSLDKMFEKILPEAPIEMIKKSKIQGYATAARLVKGKDRLFKQLDNKKMEKVVFDLNRFYSPHIAILASVSMPVIFGPTTILGSQYVDGGMVDNCPVDPVIDEGCNIILTVPLDYKFNPEVYLEKDVLIIDFSAISVFSRSDIVGLLDAVKFEETYIEETEKLGYEAGKMIISKLYDENIIEQNTLGKIRWMKPNGYTYIGLDKIEEIEMKKIKKEVEKTIKKDKNQKNKKRLQ